MKHSTLNVSRLQKYSLVLLILCIFTASHLVSATKVVILNDLHLDPYYDPAVAVQDDCRGPNPFSWLNIADSDFAPYGRYGCDTPTSLITLFMKKVKEFCGDPDVILVSGDFAAHDVAAKRGQAEPHYDILKSIISQDFNQYIGAMFPNSSIIPTIGNNDVKYHYEYPLNEDDSHDYYGFLYDLWWNQVPGNSNYTKKEEVKSSMMKGGYFIYEHNTNLTFIAVNSLYFSIKNAKYNSTVSNEQLDWIELKLKNSNNSTKFIISMHVFPGMYNPGERQQFWQDEFTNRFDDIMRKYGSKVILLNGAHTHISDIRGSWMFQNSSNPKRFLKNEDPIKTPYYANFVSPSFSPFYLNNPGFSSFNIDDTSGKIDNLTSYFFELDKTYNSTRTDLAFHTVSYEKEFGIKEWSPSEVYNFMNRAQKDNSLFKKFLILKLGYRLDQEKAAMNVYTNLGMIDFDNNNKIYWCFFQFIRSNEYDACLTS